MDNPITLRVTQLRDWGGCPRRYLLDLLYDDGSFSKAFALGTAVHAGLQAHYHYKRVPEMQDYDDLPGAVARNIQAHANGMLVEWSYVQRPNEVGFDEIVRTAQAMVAHYIEHDAREPLLWEGEHILAVEERATVEIPDPGGAGTGAYLSGQLDLVVATNRGPRIWDHKTFSTVTIEREKPWATIDVDEQLTAYAWLWWKMTGDVAANVAYNVLIKDTPQPPAVLKNGSLSKAKDQKTTAALYRSRIQELGLSYADYFDILTHLDVQGDTRYFQRWVTTRNLHELRAFERRMYYKLMDIQRLIEQPERYAYPNPSVYRCGTCPFKAVCKATDDGGDPYAILDGYREKELFAVVDY